MAEMYLLYRIDTVLHQFFLLHIQFSRLYLAYARKEQARHTILYTHNHELQLSHSCVSRLRYWNKKSEPIHLRWQRRCFRLLRVYRVLFLSCTWMACHCNHVLAHFVNLSHIQLCNQVSGQEVDEICVHLRFNELSCTTHYGLYL